MDILNIGIGHYPDIPDKWLSIEEDCYKLPSDLCEKLKVQFSEYAWELAKTVLEAYWNEHCEHCERSFKEVDYYQLLSLADTLFELSQLKN